MLSEIRRKVESEGVVLFYTVDSHALLVLRILLVMYSGLIASALIAISL